jgi:hypothetical protein
MNTAKVYILTETHTSAKARDVTYALRQLAEERKIIFLDESMNVGTNTVGSYHKPLDDNNVSLLGSVISSLMNCVYIVERGVTIEQYCDQRIDHQSNLIKNAGVFAIKNYIFTYVVAYDHFIKLPAINDYISRHSRFGRTRTTLNKAVFELSSSLTVTRVNEATEANIRVLYQLVSAMFDAITVIIEFFTTASVMFIDTLGSNPLLYQIREILTTYRSESDLYTAYRLNFQLRNDRMVDNIIDSCYITAGRVIIIAKVGTNHVRDGPNSVGISTILLENSIKPVIYYIDDSFDLNDILK